MQQKNINLIILIFAVVVLLIEEIGYILGGQPDAALPLFGWYMPIPYGLFWVWINPWFSNPSLYKIYIACFVIAFTVLQTILVLKGKIPFLILLLNGLQTLLWVYVGGYQHITLTAFAVLSFWNPFFGIGWILQKFPIGMGYASWDCDFGFSGKYIYLPGYGSQICGPNMFAGSIMLLYWHLMEITWVSASMVYWIWKWKKYGIRSWFKL